MSDDELAFEPEQQIPSEEESHSQPVSPRTGSPGKGPRRRFGVRHPRLVLAIFEVIPIGLTIMLVVRLADAHGTVGSGWLAAVCLGAACSLSLMALAVVLQVRKADGLVLGLSVALVVSAAAVVVLPVKPDSALAAGLVAFSAWTLGGCRGRCPVVYVDIMENAGPAACRRPRGRHSRASYAGVTVGAHARSWNGVFRNSHGKIVRWNVNYWPSTPALHAGSVIPALDAGDRSEVFPRHGANDWEGPLILIVPGAAMAGLVGWRSVSDRRRQDRAMTDEILRAAQAGGGAALSDQPPGSASG